jgi:hypothetical protein
MFLTIDFFFLLTNSIFFRFDNSNTTIPMLPMQATTHPMLLLL